MMQAIASYMAFLVVFTFHALWPISPAAAAPDAPAAFDNRTNGVVLQLKHKADQDVFEEVEDEDEGLGPVFNERSCAACHVTPVIGGTSEVTEMRVGHESAAKFVDPTLAIGGGQTIPNRSLINAFQICAQIVPAVPASENIRTKRLALSILGDGFVEAVANETFFLISKQQCAVQAITGICGQVVNAPLLEAPGKQRVGRFGWKNQHASLLSFSADAYRNEMGITSQLFPDEATTVCDAVPDPEDEENVDVEAFARFMRATKAPPRDALKALSVAGLRGSKIFDDVQCSVCHVRTLTTVPPGTPINGGKFVVPFALGNKDFHPFGDFLLHDVGTGDGFPAFAGSEDTRNKLRTMPLWGLRTRTRLLHDASATTPLDAIAAHKGEASKSAAKFNALSQAQKDDLLQFLRSL